MRAGGAWSRLQKLLDLALDAGIVSCAFDAHAAVTGSMRQLAAHGAEALRQIASAELRAGDVDLADSAESDDVAWFATRDGPLARLFAALGLDGRLRRHPRPLGPHAKADVVRVLVGEVDRAGIDSSWREDLLRGLANALLQVHFERRSAMDQRVVHSASSPAATRGSSPAATRDAKLAYLLRTGSVRSIVARLFALNPLKGHRARNRLHQVLVELLPELTPLRLVVFMQVLQALCQPSGLSPFKSDSEQACLATTVAEAVLAAGLQWLPFETVSQLSAIRRSPYLSELIREGLLELMVPADGAAAAEAADAEVAVGMPPPQYREQPVEEPVYEEVLHPAPVATVGLDMNHDGLPDVYVSGADYNHDGIPDALQADLHDPRSATSADLGWRRHPSLWLPEGYAEASSLIPRAAPFQAAPIATMGIDVNRDGRADLLISGVDRNRDGIPDVLQRPMQQASSHGALNGDRLLMSGPSRLPLHMHDDLALEHLVHHRRDYAVQDDLALRRLGLPPRGYSVQDDLALEQLGLPPREYDYSARLGRAAAKFRRLASEDAAMRWPARWSLPVPSPAWSY